MLEVPLLTIRPATDADRDLCVQWWRAADAPTDDVFPAIGVVCEDERVPCGIVWAYLNAKVAGMEAAPGVAFVEWLAMRPGLTLRQSAATGRALMDGIESATKPLGYGLLVAYALPACARYLRSFGWECWDERGKIAMFKSI